MLFLLTNSSQKLKLEKFRGTLIILFYVSPSSTQLQKLFFFYQKNKKTTIFQQVTGGKKPMLELELFLKIRPLKKILKF